MRWAHSGSPIRRRQARPKSRIADQGLARINKLFEIERRYRGQAVSERHRLRQEHLAPRLDELREWIAAAKGRVPPKSLTGQAIDYLESQWSKLVRVLEHGRLELTTNSVERSIRAFVIGRKAWGATASARLYSLVETAKANGLEPWPYLQTIFARLPLARGRADYEALLPWRLLPESSATPTVRQP